MPTNKKGQTLSAHRPSEVERILDATLGAGTRQLQRFMGSSERDAQVEGSRAMNNFETLTGFQGLEGSLRRVFGGNASGRDYVTAGIAALPIVGRATPLVKRAVGAADEALLGRRLDNIVVPKPNPAAETSLTKGRGLTSPEQVTYASRRVSTAELEDVLKKGRFNEPPQGSKHTDKPAKWWSAADEQGIFGRHWPKGEHVVRVPIGKVNPGRAVSAKHAEVFDPATKQWVPFSMYAKKYAMGGVVIADGNPAKRRKLI